MRTESGAKDCQSCVFKTRLWGLKSMLPRGRINCPMYYVFFNGSRTKFEVFIVKVWFSVKFWLCAILKHSELSTNFFQALLFDFFVISNALNLSIWTMFIDKIKSGCEKRWFVVVIMQLVRWKTANLKFEAFFVNMFCKILGVHILRYSRIPLAFN